VVGNEFAGTVVVLQDGGRWWRYAAPERVVVADHAATVDGAIRAVEAAVEQEGFHAAGYLAYEAGAAYGLSTHPPAADGPPLLWFGLFRRRAEIEPPIPTGDYHFGAWRASLEFPAYRARVDRIRAAIAAGHTYQANLTFQLQADFAGEPWALFVQLAAAQRAHNCAYVDLGRFAICSASPELFFTLDGDALTSRPMKGTAPRGLTPAGDQAQIAWLRASDKNRAENVMIVDMIRNDFGRVARVGSVDVPELFTVERYPTLLQMTSTVTARSDAPLADILAATFPCASITGAPKVRTMGLLRELEDGPRGIYTGAIGRISPGRRARFNVAIRTAVIDRAHGRAAYGVGSGIVWDSDAAAEYDECLLKARVLEARSGAGGDFALLESLRWTPAEGYFLLARHVTRLLDTAEYFDFPATREVIERALGEWAAGLTAPSKVRLLLHRDGRIAVEAALLPPAEPGPLRVALARQPISSTDVRLYHKTTGREPYEAARAARPDADEVILWNERGEVTELSTSNLVLELDAQLVTPPVSSGLLAGTLRAEMLAAGQIGECMVTLDDLGRATGLWAINSVRGKRTLVLLESSPNLEPSAPAMLQ